jgi:hypothetical protein
MATPEDSTLIETINRPIDPFSSLGQINTQSSGLARGKKAREMEESFLREKSQAQMEEDRELARLKKAQIAAEERNEKDYVRGLEKASGELRAATQGYPERKITNFDAASGLELASLTALIGAFGGSVSGRAGLAAMEGMSRGVKEGRQDLYNRELKAYEAEVAKFKDKISIAKDIYEDALKLENARRGAGAAKLKELDPLLQDSFIALKGRTRGFTEVGQSIQDAKKLADNVELTLYKAIEGKGKEKEPSKEERDRIALRQSIKNRIPALVSLIKDNKQQLGLKTLLNEQLISRLDVGGVPLRSALAQMDADYRFSKGGKALTKNENEILRGVTDWKGKTAESIIKQLNALESYVETDQNVYRQLYPDFMSRLGGAAPVSNSPEIKSAKMANVRATARARNISEDAAKDLYIKRGYTIAEE